MTRQFRPEQMELGEVPSEDIYIKGLLRNSENRGLKPDSGRKIENSAKFS